MNRYEVIQPIGSGASAVVYEALDVTLGRRVALKVRSMLAEGLNQSRAGERFLREARAAAQVQHPGIVTVFDFGMDADLAFLAMELVEGETLAQRLAREEGLGVARALEILLPILSAVGWLHAHGILHRDIKPANILLQRGEGGQAKLADFGLCRFVEGASAVTESGVTLGTPEYMAPEVLLGEQEATERSDQYALAVVLFECLTGVRPFRGRTAYELMHAVAIGGSFKAPSSVALSVPSGVDPIVRRAMHRDPQQRYPTVGEFAEGLLAFARETMPSRWPAELAPSRPDSDPRPRSERSPVAAPHLVANDGVALAMRGDALVVFWKAPATLSRVKWTFDRVDFFASQILGTHLVLVILLPSSSPPDAETTLECMRRIRKWQSSVRRHAYVAVGGGIWKKVIRSVFSAMMLPRSGRTTLSGSIEDGIASLQEKRSSETPTFEEVREDVLALCDALEIVAPEMSLGKSTARRSVRPSG